MRTATWSVNLITNWMDSAASIWFEIWGSWIRVKTNFYLSYEFF